MRLPRVAAHVWPTVESLRTTRKITTGDQLLASLLRTLPYNYVDNSHNRIIRHLLTSEISGIDTHSRLVVYSGEYGTHRRNTLCERREQAQVPRGA